MDSCTLGTAKSASRPSPTCSAHYVKNVSARHCCRPRPGTGGPQKSSRPSYNCGVLGTQYLIRSLVGSFLQEWGTGNHSPSRCNGPPRCLRPRHTFIIPARLCWGKGYAASQGASMAIRWKADVHLTAMGKSLLMSGNAIGSSTERSTLAGVSNFPRSGSEPNRCVNQSRGRPARVRESGQRDGGILSARLTAGGERAGRGGSTSLSQLALRRGFGGGRQAQGESRQRFATGFSPPRLGLEPRT